MIWIGKGRSVRLVGEDLAERLLGPLTSRIELDDLAEFAPGEATICEAVENHAMRGRLTMRADRIFRTERR